MCHLEIWVDKSRRSEKQQTWEGNVHSTESWLISGTPTIKADQRQIHCYRGGCVTICVCVRVCCLLIYSEPLRKYLQNSTCTSNFLTEAIKRQMKEHMREGVRTLSLQRMQGLYWAVALGKSRTPQQCKIQSNLWAPEASALWRARRSFWRRRRFVFIVSSWWW